MSANFELSAEDRELYVEKIVQVGLAALQSRAKGGHKESEAATRKEAEQVVQAAYTSCSTTHELKLKIGKMVRKLDPYAAVNTFQQNRPLLMRLLDSDNPVIQRDKALLQTVLRRDPEPSGLVQALDEVMKANSLAEKYKALEAEVLLVKLAPALQKIQGVAWGGAADLLSRVCAEELPKITQGLTQLALTPAIRAHIAACLTHLRVDTGGAVNSSAAAALKQDPAKLAVNGRH